MKRTPFIPQGVDQQGRYQPTVSEQGWPARHCSPEQHFIDRLPEEYDADDQADSADGEVLRWLGRLAAYVAAVGFVAWLLDMLAKGLQ